MRPAQPSSSSENFTFAPSLPALLSDYVFESELALGKSISLLAVINYSIAAICLGACLKYYRQALTEARAWQAGGETQAA